MNITKFPKPHALKKSCERVLLEFIEELFGHKKYCNDILFSKTQVILQNSIERGYKSFFFCNQEGRIIIGRISRHPKDYKKQILLVNLINF